MSAKATWQKLKRPALSQGQIDEMYYTYRISLDPPHRIAIDRGREGRTKTITDLVDLGLIE